MSAGDVQSRISQAKAKGKSPEVLVHEALILSQSRNGDASRLIADIYLDYARELREANSLDFDDLLVCGVELLRRHPNLVRNVAHVLVDEL
jgi:DNA helicase-2/ATP-dependent DNA helicase PcrA